MSKETETVIPIIPMHKSVAVVIMVLVCLVGVSTIQPVEANPQFIISSWTYPDQYGQGISSFTVYENSTGDWLIVGGFAPNAVPTGSGLFDNWTIGAAIKLKCECWLNNTMVEADDITDGRNYLRHTVNVTTNGVNVFSQGNFTYFNSGAAGSMYAYDYTVILNFIPAQGHTYIATITYEVYY